MDKKCSRCNNSKSISGFYKDKKKYDGFCNICKICDSEVKQRAVLTKIAQKYNVDINIFATHKICRICQIAKPIEEFPLFNKKLQISMRKKIATCYKCYRLKQGQAEKKYQYGITPECHTQMINNQKNRCLICENECSKLYVDHNHNTGKVRGLLCRPCNSLLGFAKDNQTILQKAIDYLKNFDHQPIHLKVS